MDYVTCTEATREKKPPRPKNTAPAKRAKVVSGNLTGKELHQKQYAQEAASFFKELNDSTGRPDIYYSYIAGSIGGQVPTGSAAEQKIAVDFGCGTGWLTSSLLELGFTNCYGIDSSTDMLRMAFKNTKRELTESNKVRFQNRVSPELIGKCDLVTAVHVHYHFLPLERLEKKFFGVISSLLSPTGTFVLIGCPSNHLRETPPHYQNSIHISDIPKDIRKSNTIPPYGYNKDGYIELSLLPPFKLKDSTQMKVMFTVEQDGGAVRKLQLTDTFWSDETLIGAAQRSGLDLIRKQDLRWREYPHAYMAMNFRKRSPSPDGALRLQ